MSVKSRQHLSRVMGQYTDLTNRFLARWHVAADDLLQQRYTPTRLLSDAFGFWSGCRYGDRACTRARKRRLPDESIDGQDHGPNRQPNHRASENTRHECRAGIYGHCARRRRPLTEDSPSARISFAS
jgi:hypothetical protein